MKSSFSSPKTTTTRHRASQSISGNPFTQEPLSKYSASKTKDFKTTDILDTKNSRIHDRTRMSSSPQNHALRDLSNLVGESLLCSNLHSMANTPDMSMTNALNDAIPSGSQRKLIEEVNMLKKEIEQKNTMIDKLMKENLNLRKEMEEFLTTVDEAREYIDVELKECNNRIYELEAEIQELRTENQMYKDQLSKKLGSSTSETARENRITTNFVDEDVDGYYGQAKKEMEDFYFRLNEQIIGFMEVSKKQYHEFNNIINTKITQNTSAHTREETPVLKTCPSSPKRENSSSASAAKLTGPKPARTRNSSMSMSYKNIKSPMDKSPLTPKTPKTPKSMGLDLKNNKTPKNSGDMSVNRSIDFRVVNQSSASRKRGSCTSMNRLEVESGNGGMLLGGDLNGQRNPTSHALSPKSSLLRAKLKSDMILQEMRRKIGEGLSNNL